LLLNFDEFILKMPCGVRTCVGGLVRSYILSALLGNKRILTSDLIIKLTYLLGTPAFLSSDIVGRLVNNDPALAQSLELISWWIKDYNAYYLMCKLNIKSLDKV
jgi:hypothetical protein